MRATGPGSSQSLSLPPAGVTTRPELAAAAAAARSLIKQLPNTAAAADLTLDGGITPLLHAELQALRSCRKRLRAHCRLTVGQVRSPCGVAMLTGEVTL